MNADTPKLEFLCDEQLDGKIPAPAPAVRFAPDWFKKLERDMGMPNAEGLPAMTVKGCLPVTDAITAGYIIPLPISVRIIVPEDRISIQMGWAEDAPFTPVEQHHPGQIGAPNAPFERTMPLKFINPWRISAPEGYSVLFTHPLNHFQLPFTSFSGMVDCDHFKTTINFPFAWTAAPGDYTLSAGLPIIQLIPIRRDSLLKEFAVRPSKKEERDEQGEAAKKKYGEVSAYMRQWRVKK
ncbi:hypothetical protein [Hyphococcus sp.]|uniref:hypothetical protein n=1 Tax=Hyphococcus sp. TaxID=2038636 RepID=UPI00208A6A8F|nr:MAG: hypothetical protein DHS20C04_00300 [Marinicaulis sp.]